MTRTIAIRRESNRVAIVESDGGVEVAVSYYSADLAVDTGHQLIRIGAAILAEERAKVTTMCPIAAAKAEAPTP